MMIISQINKKQLGELELKEFQTFFKICQKKLYQSCKRLGQFKNREEIWYWKQDKKYKTAFRAPHVNKTWWKSSFQFAP